MKAIARRFFFALLIGSGLSFLAYERTDGFSPSLIENPLFYPISISEDSFAFSTEIRKALSQPYRYLGKGRQSFVFESADGETVLKFFNQKYFQMPWYIHFLVGEKWKSQEKKKRETRKNFYRESYPIAWRELKEETGILYLHFGSAQKKLPSLLLIDRASRRYTIDLNKIPFVLQKKGDPFYPTLEALYRSEGLPALFRAIDSFLDRIASRIGKKIADADRDVEHNWGYRDGKAMHLDPGRFSIDETLSESGRIELEWSKATHSFRKWLIRLDPGAAAYLDTKIARKKGDDSL